ncbi:anhydro-N-acetylmuramic acid kinase [Streptomyces sp. PKU-MA01144]|uniref:anhydro-N-acetylmuramic acid kinase n=1 Tax=Streptomyces sp. PKU-MA01144 TaxID=2729138 RepID=UPI00147A75D8|nr:anhydro-N-acetylmuramic acid kinase [Streptomyces sp. PKU-MA01144]NNJ07041.1 anhydro-N-acetylmuramic acid kinase [Streptomyces sp. PKU-MA01144]
MRVVGLMSGTSYDAIDAAAADLTVEDGTLVLTPLGMVSEPYDDDLRALLAGALPPSTTTLADVCRLDTLVGRAFADVAVRADRELCGGAAELVASHGQTVFHWAGDGRVHGTLQIGEPAWIAEATGRTVVSGFRTRDVAAGGQGAPLVSLVDLMWLRGRPGVPAALNIGGIANVTVLPRGGRPVAFDTGPGNALIDAAAHDLTGGRLAYDAGGALAGAGRVHEPLLRRLLDEPYYRRPAPRTTGKELFHRGYLRAALEGFGGLPAEDVVATVTRLTARTVADAVRPLGATELIASGGGTRNPVLTAMLRDELAGVALRTSDELGLPSSAKEACAFAVLGYLTLHGLPGNAPSCTGALGPRVLGSITPGSRPLRLPGAPAAAPASLVVRARPDRSPPPGEHTGALPAAGRR